MIAEDRAGQEGKMSSAADLFIAEGTSAWLAGPPSIQPVHDSGDQRYSINDPAGGVPQRKQAVFPYKRWTTSKPVLKRGASATFDDVAVKDPSIVFHGGRWHVVYTNKSSQRDTRYEDGAGYVSAETLDGLQSAKRYNLNAIVGGPVVAPQIFYFRPQKLWYIIAQQPHAGPSELAPILPHESGHQQPGRLVQTAENQDEPQTP